MLHENISERDFLLQTAVIIETIWYSRHLYVHQGKLQNPIEMMAEMNRRLRKNLAAWSEAEAAQQTRWQPPQPGLFKVNHHIRGRMVFPGVVCRPSDRTLTQAWGDFAITSNPLLAEVRANCLLACQMVHHLDLRQVIFAKIVRAILELDFLSKGPLVR